MLRYTIWVKTGQICVEHSASYTRVFEAKQLSELKNNTNNSDPQGLYCMVLAAGSASRFGSAKQLACWNDQSLIRRALELANDACDSNTVLVLGAHWQEVLEESRPLNGFVVLNQHYESGMASSIACGVRTLDTVATAVLILLVDQPLISATHLQTLKEAWQTSPSSIVVSSFAGAAGPPIIIPSTFFADLESLSGDHGARELLSRDDVDVIRVDCPEAAMDVDRPEDLEKLS